MALVTRSSTGSSTVINPYLGPDAIAKPSPDKVVQVREPSGRFVPISESSQFRRLPQRPGEVPQYRSVQSMSSPAPAVAVSTTPVAGSSWVSTTSGPTYEVRKEPLTEDTALMSFAEPTSSVPQTGLGSARVGPSTDAASIAREMTGVGSLRTTQRAQEEPLSLYPYMRQTAPQLEPARVRWGERVAESYKGMTGQNLAADVASVKSFLTEPTNLSRKSVLDISTLTPPEQRVAQMVSRPTSLDVAGVTETGPFDVASRRLESLYSGVISAPAGPFSISTPGTAEELLFRKIPRLAPEVRDEPITSVSEFTRVAAPVAAVGGAYALGFTEALYLMPGTALRLVTPSTSAETASGIVSSMVAFPPAVVRNIVSGNPVQAARLLGGGKAYGTVFKAGSDVIPYKPVFEKWTAPDQTTQLPEGLLIDRVGQPTSVEYDSSTFREGPPSPQPIGLAPSRIKIWSPQDVEPFQYTLQRQLIEKPLDFEKTRAGGKSVEELVMPTTKKTVAVLALERQPGQTVGGGGLPPRVSIPLLTYVSGEGVLIGKTPIESAVFDVAKLPPTDISEGYPMPERFSTWQRIRPVIGATESQKQSVDLKYRITQQLKGEKGAADPGSILFNVEAIPESKRAIFTQETARFLKEEGGIAYGSLVTMLTDPKYRSVNIGDIDAKFNTLSERLAPKIGKLADRLQEKGIDVQVSKADPTILESSEPGQFRGQKVFEAKTKDTPKDQLAPSKWLSQIMELKNQNIRTAMFGDVEIPIATTGQQTVAKAAGSSMVRGRVVGDAASEVPEAFRGAGFYGKAPRTVKDIGGLVQITTGEIARLKSELEGKSRTKAEQLRYERAIAAQESVLKDLAQSYTPEQQFEIKKYVETRTGREVLDDWTVGQPTQRTTAQRILSSIVPTTPEQAIFFGTGTTRRDRTAVATSFRKPDEIASTSSERARIAIDRAITPGRTFYPPAISRIREGDGDIQSLHGLGDSGLFELVGRGGGSRLIYSPNTSPASYVFSGLSSFPPSPSQKPSSIIESSIPPPSPPPPPSPKPSSTIIRNYYSYEPSPSPRVPSPLSFISSTPASSAVSSMLSPSPSPSPSSPSQYYIQRQSSFVSPDLGSLPTSYQRRRRARGIKSWTVRNPIPQLGALFFASRKKIDIMQYTGTRGTAVARNKIRRMI